jgi:hypothetical protein
MPRKPVAAGKKTPTAKTLPPLTPDGRYIVVRGRLWRASNPGLTPEARQGYVNDLQVCLHGFVPGFSICSNFSSRPTLCKLTCSAKSHLLPVGVHAGCKAGGQGSKEGS